MASWGALARAATRPAVAGSGGPRLIASSLVRRASAQAAQWRLHEAEGPGEQFAGRSSHSVSGLAGQLVVFGGEDSPRNAFDPRLWVFSAGPKARLGKVEGWRAHAAAPPPAPLLGHATAAVGNILLSFGGRTGGSVCFDSDEPPESLTETDVLFAFEGGGNAVAGPWRTIQPDHRPAARSFHAMTSVGSSAYVFGGCGVNGRLNDLWRFDYDRGHHDRGRWTHLSAGSEAGAPSARGGAVLLGHECVDGSHRLLMLHGFNGSQQGDVFCFTEADGWVEVTDQQRGAVPSPRSVAAGCAVPRTLINPRSGHEYFLYFGGEVEASDQGHEGAGEFDDTLWCLDSQTFEWVEVKTVGARPDGRGWGGAAIAAGSPGERAESLYVCGGLAADGTRLGDLWELPLPLEGLPWRFS